jgi:hypothetical protein
MSKWVNDDLFGKFQEQKKEEKEAPRGGVSRLDKVWPTPEKGTDSVAKVYKGRFLPDPDGEFYKQYYYHMYRSGEKWVFAICPKTDNFDNYCPFCSVTSKLYMGTAADKKMANNYKRKRKYVSNFFITDDPRDNEREAEKKVNGTVKLYEFPNKVEIKLKEEITDPDGLGISVFDPGEGGYDFILKVMATKKDDKGTSWPDYATSTFARRSGAIGSDSEIESLMEQRSSLKEYIDDQRKTEEELIKLVKSELLFDMVKDEYDQLLRKRNAMADSEKTESPFVDETEGIQAPGLSGPTPEPDDIPDEALLKKHKDNEKAAAEETSNADEDLLAELEKMTE